MERSVPVPRSRPSRTRLLLAVFAAYSLHFSTGAVIAWPSPMIPRLNLTASENSLLSSLFSLGAAPGPIIASLGLDTIGRRGTLFTVSAAFLASWVLLLCSQNIVVMYLARLLGGMGIGGAFAGVSVYVAEITDDETRGPLGSLLQTFIAMGLLVEYCVGPWVGFTVLAGVSLAVTLLFLVLFFAFAPESPHYLVAKGKTKEAYSAILAIRGALPQEEFDREITQIQASLKAEHESVSGLKKVLSSSTVHRGLGICFLLLMMQQGSGANAVLAYVQFIFELADIHLSPELVAILVGLTNLFASLPSPLLVRRFGNKLVFTMSCLGAGICLCLLGLYFFLLSWNYDVQNIGFLPVVSVILFNIFFCFGLGPLVWGVAAELFSPSVKGIAMGIAGVFSAVFGFFAIEIFSTVLHTYGPTSVFFGYGVYLVLGGIVCYLFVPDTSKMSLQEIQDYLADKQNTHPSVISMEDDREVPRGSRLKLFFAAFAAFSLHFSTGASIAWPSPMIPRLNLTASENSLLSSLFSLGLAPGQFITSIGMDLIGRKLTLYVVSFTFLLEWVLLLASQDVIVMYVARLLGGMGMGGAFSGVSVYIAEVADDRFRGPLNSLLQSFLAVGFLVEYLVGPEVDFSSLAWVSLALVVLFMVLFFFAPESPHYLVAKGRTSDALESLRFLRGSDMPAEKIQMEIAVIQEGLKREEDGSNSSNNPCFTLVTSTACRRGLALGLLLLALQQGSAINAILAYVEYIFGKAKLDLSSTLVPVLVGLTHLVFSLPVPFLVRKLGYKVLFFISNLGGGISLVMVGIYFCLLRHDYDISQITFLPVVGIVLFNVFFCLALGPLSWALVAELYAPSVKSLAVGICGVFNAVFGFATVQVFSILLDDYGFDVAFFGFGGYLLLGALACLVFVPDTSKMSLHEIQDYLGS